MRKKLLFLFAALLSFIGIQSAKAQHDYVDLGLPSGTLWATCNVGASTSEGIGKYFAWGEVEDKSSYTWYSYMHCYIKNTADVRLKKYCNNLSYYWNETPDDLTELQPVDDAATALWGAGWQMPTVAQFEELINSDYTTFEAVLRNGQTGCKFTSKINGNSIFLPYAGMQTDETIDYKNYEACYWSRSVSLVDCRQAHYFSADYHGMNTKTQRRFIGCSIRPVRNPVAYVISNIPDGWQANGTTTTGSYEMTKGGSIVFTPVNIPPGKKIKSVKVIKE